MGSKINWSEDQDATIRQMIGAGFSYDSTAIACRVAHRQQIIDRCKVIGVKRPTIEDCSENDMEREPLPSGSEASWFAINAGLSIAGEVYPREAFAA